MRAAPPTSATHPMDHALPACLGATRLRKLRPQDLVRFHQTRCDPELAKYQGWGLMSKDEAAGFLGEMSAVASLVAGGWIQLAIADARTDKLIGDIGLYLEADRSAAEIGFTLHADSHAKGHAARAVELAAALAFTLSPVPALRAITDARNLPSIRVLERCGFTRLHEQQVMFKGEACTELVYTRARERAA